MVSRREVSGTATTASVSVVILTKNEERNLPACLASVSGWVHEVFVVDSGSTDGTAGIAAAAGARVVVHPFESHTRQWRWALAELPIGGDWVLALDADQRVSPELRRSIERALAGAASPGAAPAGFFLNRRQIFRGRWIRYGGYYPKYLLKLFRRGAAALDETDRVDHHFKVSGPAWRLQGDLIEDNQNEARIADWIEKHNRYARLQAAEEIARRHEGAPAGRLMGNPDERTSWLKDVWGRLPLYVRPIGYFLYRYILRLGFLDGKEGFVFHFMQALWYRLLVDINRDEIASARAADR
jgi:glycosyltransferase involved in cell wall biosynthesis